MMKRKYYIPAVLTCVWLASSCEESLPLESPLPDVQQRLLGSRVSFDMSRAEDFDLTRTTYIDNGSFNEGDQMVIFRQYWDDKLEKWEDLQSFRDYHYDYRYVAGTNVSLGREWKVTKDRWMGDNWESSDNPGAHRGQTEADSLIWENGKTVRFRAWSRSDYAGCIETNTAESYYPDYCIADWVTVSGPTLEIPLTLRHVTCRIAIDYLPGNQFYNGEICLDTDAYLWDDNADSYDHDQTDKRTPEQAQAAVDSVREVFDRLCMPAGVRIEDGSLRTMTQTLYESLSASRGFRYIEQKTAADGIVDYGALTPDQIRDNVKHPSFSHVNGRLYMITIPYDMSNASTQGDVLTLPPCTRFRIRLYDINHGDKDGHPSYEFKEHIFALSDIRDPNDQRKPKYPDGLPLIPGRSYKFRVGYHYDQFHVTLVEEGIHWSEQAESTGDAEEQEVHPDIEHVPYKWWKESINNAILNTLPSNGSKDYNPVFQISTREDFKEFIALVNGTASICPPGLHLKQALRGKDKPNPDADLVLDNDETRRYWWYDVDATAASLQQAGGDTVWVTRAEAEAQGLVFYRHYFPQVGDRPAYSVETYLDSPFSFYDESVNLNLVVQIRADIDLADWELDAIGRHPVTQAYSPFKGLLDGGTHTLSNVNMKDGFLFGCIEDAEIRDLRLTSTHPLAVLDRGTTSSTYRSVRLVGISLQADSPAGVPAIAGSLVGGGGATCRSYVVGCIHEGNADCALVGTADNMTMLGCMHASPYLTGAALLGTYANPGNPFLQPQQSSTVQWGRFMCCYYQRDPLQYTHAVANVADAYAPQEYIRGTRGYILKAKNDNILPDDMPYKNLSADQKREFYGLAPWHAMNYAIAQYNKEAPSSSYKSFPEDHRCHMKYQVADYGYEHLYPQLVAAGEPDAEGVVTAIVVAKDYGNINNILYLNN